MQSVLDRLQVLSSVIAEICRISGISDASIDVLHEDRFVYTHNYGFRDVEAKTSSDERTIYHVASLTKSFTAASIGILVKARKMSWDTSVHDILPDFKHVDKTINEKATIVDFMSHRHEFAEVGLRRNETLKMASYLETVFEFRTQWLYNNWGYVIADQIIQRLSGQSWGTFLSEQILISLGLNRTKTEHFPKTHDAV